MSPVKGNPRYNSPRVSPEEEWRSEAQKDLGSNYVQSILNFEKMEIEKFKEFNEKIKKFVQKRQGINSTRMRKIYEIVHQAKNPEAFLLAIPRLAYLVGREDRKENKRLIGTIFVVLQDSAKGMKSPEDLRGIQRFAEALVAYHKFYSIDQ
ncbi:MAG: CRISPR-associated protein Csm2 [Candidatus Atribacteria bacterium]|nr:CRISPR-associated protein Csm2 [Candidatus Atribacteria bacterium]